MSLKRSSLVPKLQCAASFAVQAYYMSIDTGRTSYWSTRLPGRCTDTYQQIARSLMQTHQSRRSGQTTLRRNPAVGGLIVWQLKKQSKGQASAPSLCSQHSKSVSWQKRTTFVPRYKAEHLNEPRSASFLLNAE